MDASEISLITLIVTLVMLFVGIPGAIIAIKQLRDKKEFISFLPRKFSRICIGRSEEINTIRKRIIKYKSVFIYGTGGIGKSTIVYHAITGAKKEISENYERVLYYDFSSNPNTDYAINELCKQLENPEFKEFKYLINEKKYLIWLDSCERSKRINDIIKLSDKPVFIICSRNKEQVREIESFEDTLIIRISRLSYQYAIRLLSNKLYFWKRIPKNTKEYNKKIVEFVGCHPLILSIIKNNSVYKNNPKEFYALLKKEGINSALKSIIWNYF